ncbi:uncharacterized protein [Lepisosteus oculatus]|uniref:uncharacterized protein n=1 Tax=Lepisosteus oculatus TaxID=7918 RepID=UPI00372072CF
MFRLLVLCLILGAVASGEESSGDFPDDEDLVAVASSGGQERLNTEMDKTIGHNPEEKEGGHTTIIIIAVVAVAAVAALLIVVVILARRRMLKQQQGVYTVPAEQGQKPSV